MKKKPTLLVYSVLLLLTACEENLSPDTIPTSGTITIYSKIQDNRTSGFSFSRASIVFVPNSEGVLPDIGVSVQIGEQGLIVGTFLSAPDFPRPTFCLLWRHSTIDSAEAYFKAVAQIPDTSYVDLAIPIHVGQVWAVRTREDAYAKILIRNSRAFIDSESSGAPTPYGEVEFDWTYQPNGTRRF